MKQFKPYIPADKVMPELTPTSAILGIILAVVFGGANAYLGLRVGMTVSASIPAAVLSMGIVRMIMRRDSILENNMVQTIGSAGESLAAGAIFTLPALFTDPPAGARRRPPRRAAHRPPGRERRGDHPQRWHLYRTPQPEGTQHRQKCPRRRPGRPSTQPGRALCAQLCARPQTQE